MTEERSPHSIHDLAEKVRYSLAIHVEQDALDAFNSLFEQYEREREQWKNTAQLLARDFEEAEGDGAGSIVIDADEFEAAKNNPEWRAFCEKADEYVSNLASTPDVQKGGTDA